MNRKAVALLGLCVMLSLARAAEHVDAFRRETKELSPHVHLSYRPIATNAPYEGNSIVIEQSDGLVVVDAGGSPVSGRHIAEAVGDLAKQGKPLDDVYKQVHLDDVIADFASDDAWLRKLLDPFFLHSLIKNAYFEATDQPIVQGTS